MEVVFLDCRSLEVLDFGFASDDFNIIIDCVVPQVSSFKVNKINLNVEVGDYLVIKNSPINYIGIITSLDVEDNAHVTDIKTKDFISILDIKIKLTNYSGNLIYYLGNLIKNQYVNNADAMQNLPYLTVETSGSINGALTFEEDTVSSISSVVSTLNKAYSIGVHYELIYAFGAFAGIKLYVKPCTMGLRLKHNSSSITDLVITENNTQGINKITFVPKASNTSYRNTISYYLLTNGTVTTSSTSNYRYKTVVGTTKLYGDNDYNSLLTTAKTEMMSSSFDHSITFKYLTNNKIASLFTDMNVGDFIEFIGPNKTYDTMITKINFKNNLYQPEITLGEYRVSLTEKLKLLSMK